MEDIQNHVYNQHLRITNPAYDTAMLLQNPLPNLSLTGLLAQHRQRSLEARMTKRSDRHHPLSPFQSPCSPNNLDATLPPDIPRATQNSSSVSPTSSPSTTTALTPCSPGQVTYHQSQVLYNQMHVRLNLLIIELNKETQKRGRCRKNPSRPQPRDPLVSFLEKQQEIAALQERIVSMAQAIQDLSEGVDGVCGEANLELGGEDEAAAGSSELEEWVGGRLTNVEVNEAIAEAWREVFPEMELGWYL